MRTELNYCWVCGSPAETQFAEGRKRKVCTDCGTILYQNPLPTTVAVIVNESDEVLLVQRAFAPAKGDWCLPGGFMELGETPEEGIIRELKEETNLDGTVKKLIGVSPSQYGVWGDVVVIGFTVNSSNGEMKAGDDAMGVQYFPIHNRPKLAFQTHEKIMNMYMENYHGE